MRINREGSVTQWLLSGCALLLCWASVARGAEPADSARAVVDVRQQVMQLVDAYGGRAALERVKAYRMEGRIVAAQAGREGPMTRSFQRAGKLRVELRYPDQTETRIVRGEQGWRGVGTDVRAAQGMMLDAMVMQAARSDLPLFLLAHLDSVRVIDSIERDSLRLDGLEASFGAGRSLRAYVDPATHRVLMSQSVLKTESGAMEFETNYSDFRNVGQVWFAFREDNFASGTATGTMTIEKVTINPIFKPAEFAAPR